MVWAFGWIIASRFVRKTKENESIGSRLKHILPLIAGFVLIFGTFHRTLIYGEIYKGRSTETIGMCLTVFGFAFAVWARIHLGKYWSGIIKLKEGHQIIRTGPYRWVRHPIYTGFLSAALRRAFVSGTGDAAVGFLIMLIAFLWKLSREENLLLREFGNEYGQFKKDVPALIPFVF